MPQQVSKDADSGLVVLAKAEDFKTLPSFTACPGALPDLANRYISIKTPGWHHRASARGSCLDSLNQLFAVLMECHARLVLGSDFGPDRVHNLAPEINRAAGKRPPTGEAHRFRPDATANSASTSSSVKVFTLVGGQWRNDLRTGMHPPHR